jgi:hypothetical protein
MDVVLRIKELGPKVHVMHDVTHHTNKDQVLFKQMDLSHPRITYSCLLTQISPVIALTRSCLCNFWPAYYCQLRNHGALHCIFNRADLEVLTYMPYAFNWSQRLPHAVITTPQYSHSSVKYYRSIFRSGGIRGSMTIIPLIDDISATPGWTSICCHPREWSRD